jgi:hypothetical protein
MIRMVQLVIAMLLYPGVLTALGCGVLYRFLSAGRGLGAVDLGLALKSREGLAALLSIALSGLGLALLPWPWHPGGAESGWLWAWAIFELAFLLPLLPALLAGSPRVVRAGIRAAQIGALARALLWGALGVALTIHGIWIAEALPAHLLAIVVAALTLPAALGWGPFSHEVSVTPAGLEAGLPPALVALDQFAEAVRGGALLAAALVATLPLGVASAGLGLALVASGFVTAALIMRRWDGRLPRLAQPAILRLGMLVVAPLLAAASAALIWV